MIEATKGHPRENFEKPEGIKYVKISEKTGKLPSENTPEDVIKTGIFASFSVPTQYDTSYQMVEIDKVSGKLATEFTPASAREMKAFFEHHSILPDNKYWEEAVRKWAEENDEDEKAPTEYDDVHTAENIKVKPQIVIIAPENLATVSPPYVGVWPRIDSKGGVDRVEYFWNGELIDTAISPPFKGSIKIPEGDQRKGSRHTIKAIIYDSLHRSNQSSIQVKIGTDDVRPKLDFAYPKDGIRVDTNSSIAILVNAFDPNGDILKVDFSLNNQLVETVRQPPYVWQFNVPNKEGTYVVKATAYDHARNSDSEFIQIIAKQSSNIITGTSSKIVEPARNASFSEGSNILIQVYLDGEGQNGLSEMTLLAKRKGQRPIEVAKVLGDPTAPAASLYSFIWDSAPAGTYELQLKVVLQNGKIRYSENVPIVVR